MEQVLQTRLYFYKEKSFKFANSQLYQPVQFFLNWVMKFLQYLLYWVSIISVVYLLTIAIILQFFFISIGKQLNLWRRQALILDLFTRYQPVSKGYRQNISGADYVTNLDASLRPDHEAINNQRLSEWIKGVLQSSFNQLSILSLLHIPFFTVSCLLLIFIRAPPKAVT